MDVKSVKLKDLTFDGKHIYVQSMLNTRADDIAGSVEQAIALEKAGCEIIRASIPNEAALELIPAIKEKVSVPLVADISPSKILIVVLLPAPLGPKKPKKPPSSTLRFKSIIPRVEP